MIFEVIAIVKPTDKEAKAGQLEEMIAGPSVVIAKDLESAKVQMVVANADAIKAADQERVQILARPF